MSYKITPNVEHIPFLPRIYEGPPGVWPCTCGAFWVPFWPIFGVLRVAVGHTLNPIKTTLGSLGSLLGGEKTSGRLPWPRRRCVKVLKFLFGRHSDHFRGSQPFDSLGRADRFSMCNVFDVYTKMCKIVPILLPLFGSLWAHGTASGCQHG